MNLLFFLIIENVVIMLLVVLFLYKKIKQRRSQQYSLTLNPKPKFKLFQTKNLKLRYKVYFESAHVGIYHIKLFRIKKHKHQMTSSILYITNGKAKGMIGKRKVHAKPGDIIFVPKQVPHHWKMETVLEYIEFATPSLTETKFRDVVWL